MGEAVSSLPKGARSGRKSSVRFVVTAALLSVSFFGVLRIPFVEQNLLLPFTRAQHVLACRIGGNPDAPITVGLSCSAADVIALCLGFILAFPVSWRRRLVGAALGLLFIAAVNTVRIATLSHAVVDQKLFELLHLYIWPGALLVVVSVFVFFWMTHSLKAESRVAAGTDKVAATSVLGRTSLRFMLLTLLFVTLFVGTSSWWMHSKLVLQVANWVAASGALIISFFGSEVTLTRNVLRTASGAFAVTQECIMTPLMPAYFAAALALPMSRRRRLVLLLAALPVFFALGTARLLVLAFPTRLVGSHLIAIHGFYQFLLAALLIVLAAVLAIGSGRPREVVRRSLLGLGTAGITFVAALLTYNHLLFALIDRLQTTIGHAGHLYMDSQGAVLLMVPYQIGLLIGLWLALGTLAMRRRMLLALVVLCLMQPVLLIGLGEWVAHTGLDPHVAAIRAATVLLVVFAAGWSLWPALRSRRGSSVAALQVSRG